MTDTELIITRGYAGSGKTTLALAWVREHEGVQGGPRRARVNRDDLRVAMFGADRLTYTQEQEVTVAQHAAVRALLEAGVSVIVDDTNLRLKFARAYADLAERLGVRFDVIDLPVSADECVARDAARLAAGGRGVGEDVIRGMAARFRFPLPEVTPTEDPDALVIEPYEDDESLRPAWIIDIDGTLAKKRMGEGERGWFDWDRVGEDLPYERNLELVKAIRQTPVNGVRPAILVFSGRSDECEDVTRDWLWEHLDWCDALVMRRADDQRDDAAVKYDMFNDHVRGKYRVLGVMDDRPKVCRMWRQLGLDVLQVGDPHIEF